MAINTGSHLMLTYMGNVPCMSERYDYGMLDKWMNHSVRGEFMDHMLQCCESLPARGNSLKKYMDVIEFKEESNV